MAENIKSYRLNGYAIEYIKDENIIRLGIEGEVAVTMPTHEFFSLVSAITKDEDLQAALRKKK